MKVLRPLTLFLAFGFWLLPGPPAAGQEEPESTTEERALEEGGEEPGTDEIERILAAEDEMLSGAGYSYDPGDRRDPFKSLLAARTSPEPRGPRPPGIPGLLIDEIDLTGIFIMGEGPVAQVHSADRNESHLLRVGDQLYDGDVTSIQQTEVTFRQIVDDPTAIKPFRDVVKRLNPESDR